MAPQTCVECGNAPINHRAAKVDAVLAEAMEWMQRHLGGISRPFEPLLSLGASYILPTLFHAVAMLGIGELIMRPNSEMGPRALCLWEEATKRGICVRAYRPSRRGGFIYMATYGTATTVYATVPRPGRHESSGMAWMDSKRAMRDVFLAHRIPIAKGGTVRTLHEAHTLFATLTPPVITKPSRGSRSRHTTTHIETAAELDTAFHTARLLSPWVVIEEELVGLVHRGTVIGGKVIGVLRREPASVVGDGAHTVLELIERANRDPRRDGTLFHQIALHDSEHEKELLHQGLTPTSIPQPGQWVTLSQKASRGLGGGATDLTDETHPDNITLLEQVAAVLEDPLVGIDFIIADVRKSWKEQPRSGIIECNSAPFIDLHLYPLSGKPRNTPGALWDLVFPESTKA